MPDNLNGHPQRKAHVFVLTADSALEAIARQTFGANADIRLTVTSAAACKEGDLRSATVIIADIDATDDKALHRIHWLTAEAGDLIPVIVVMHAFDAAIGRRLLQMRVADFLIKPVNAVELARTCAKAVRHPAADRLKEAQIFTFLPAGGGVGVTTLAIQTAFLLQGKKARSQRSVCLVDLDFQDGMCADYLDVEPRLDLDEIAPHPERLDRQLLEILLSHHQSGLAILAAPSRPGDARGPDPAVVTRLLDLVASCFDYVVIDMPRGWHPWSDNVLRGSNRVFVVSDMTVPRLRHARRVAAAVSDRLGGSPAPRVIVNRFERPFLSPGVRRADVRQALGEAFGGTVPYDRKTVCEAIDRGVPLHEVRSRNKIDAALRSLVLPAETSAGGVMRRLIGAA